MFLDDCTDMTWSAFLKRKSDLVERGMMILRKLRNRGMVTRYIRCDDAGENKKLEAACVKAGWDIQFEYTTPNTPQYNGRIERRFAAYHTRSKPL